MKNSLFIITLLLAGCQVPSPAIKPMPDPFPLHGPAGNYVGRSGPRTPVNDPIKPPRDNDGHESSRPVVEALIAQNDALTTRLRTLEAAKAPLVPVAATNATSAVSASVPSEASPLKSVIAESADSSLLVPNADGMIDTTSTKAGLANPFVVRTIPGEASREISLVVQGFIHGAQPSAVVNGRVVEPGDVIESLRFTRVAADALILSGDGFTVSVPLGTTKVRLAL